MSADCIFCKIIAGKIPSPKLYEDEEFICIRDVRPQAKTHLLVIPKEHVQSLETVYPEAGPSRSELVGRLFEVATRVARLTGLLPDGFRIVVNTNHGGGQTVFHLHIHLLGGTLLEEL